MSIQRPNSFHGNDDGLPSTKTGPDNGSMAATSITGIPNKKTTINSSWREWEGPPNGPKGPGARVKVDFITPRTHV